MDSVSTAVHVAVLFCLLIWGPPIKSRLASNFRPSCPLGLQTYDIIPGFPYIKKTWWNPDKPDHFNCYKLTVLWHQDIRLLYGIITVHLQTRLICSNQNLSHETLPWPCPITSTQIPAETHAIVLSLLFETGSQDMAPGWPWIYSRPTKPPSQMLGLQVAVTTFILQLKDLWSRTGVRVHTCSPGPQEVWGQPGPYRETLYQQTKQYSNTDSCGSSL